MSDVTNRRYRNVSLISLSPLPSPLSVFHFNISLARLTSTPCSLSSPIPLSSSILSLLSSLKLPSKSEGGYSLLPSTKGASKCDELSDEQGGVIGEFEGECEEVGVVEVVKHESSTSGMGRGVF